jgi:hypothetical protein
LPTCAVDVAVSFFKRARVVAGIKRPDALQPLARDAQSTADSKIKQILNNASTDRTSSIGAESAWDSKMRHTSANRRSASGPLDFVNSKLEGALFAPITVFGMKSTAIPPLANRPRSQNVRVARAN